MIVKTLNEAVEEVLAHPDSKVVTLTDDYRLWFEGRRTIEAKTFILSTPLGVVASTPDTVWYPEDQELDLPANVGILSPEKLLMLGPDEKAYFWDQKCLPEKPLHFVLFAEFNDFAEAYIATPAIGTPIHLRWPDEKSRQLRGLCCSLIALTTPEIKGQLGAFLLEVNALEAAGKKAK